MPEQRKAKTIINTRTKKIENNYYSCQNKEMQIQLLMPEQRKAKTTNNARTKKGKTAINARTMKGKNN